ncbi:MAG TPA: methylated-DNA--[protein]-cysteine S-methyltransferase [Stellaceae bacterium]|jgi:methylated-DNA-[protein]-cysteine S-methyltransferase
MPYCIAIDSPVGPLAITESDDAIVAVGWGNHAGSEATPLLAEARRQLAAYFERRLTSFDLPLRPAGSAFEQRVWAAMRQIPHGQTRSYGELAMEIGSAPRAIGRACGKNPIPIMIPCHRVLARSGLGGYSGGAGLETKRALLALEGGAPAPAHVSRNSAVHSAALSEPGPKAEHAALVRPTSA